MSQKKAASRKRGRPPSGLPAADRQVAVRLTPELYDAVSRLADAEDRPISSYLRRIVAERVEAERLLGSAVTPPGPPSPSSTLAAGVCRDCRGSGLVDLPADEDDGACPACGGTGLSA